MRGLTMKEKTTKEQLEIAIKEANNILSWISNIVKGLEEDEYSLSDLVAEEESLENRCYELQEKMKEVVSLREWSSFEDLF